MQAVTTPRNPQPSSRPYRARHGLAPVKTSACPQHTELGLYRDYTLGLEHDETQARHRKAMQRAINQ